MLEYFQNIEISEQTSFAIRVCAFVAAFLVSCILTRELVHKISKRLFYTPFWLIVSFLMVALGLTMMTAWSVTYTYTRITGLPAEWMLDSPVIPFYTLFMVASAVLVVRALAINPHRAWLAAALIAISGAAAYIWIGSYT